MKTQGSGARIRPLFHRAACIGPILGDSRDGVLYPRRLFDAPAGVRLLAAAESAPEPPQVLPPRGGTAPLSEDFSSEAPPAPSLAEDPVPPPAVAAPVVDPYAEVRLARAEAEKEKARYLQALVEIERVHAMDFSALENDLADVALEIARQIIMRELTTDRLYVVRLVEAALRVAVEDDAATVSVSPQDLAWVEQERTRLEVSRGGGLIRVGEDPALHPGDCVVQVGRARIDARLGDRLERVRQAMHGVVTETE